jgi:hypothetical protein
MGGYDVRQTGMGGGDESLIKEVSGPLFGAKGWMKFLGVLLIIYGVLMIITIWGIIICWLPIWMGILLFKAGAAIELAATSGSKPALYETMEKLKTYFTVQGILAVVGLVIAVIAMIVGLAAGLTGLLGNM